jgi:cyanate permease
LARANNQDHAGSTCSVSAQAQIESQDSGNSLSHMQAGDASCMPWLDLSEPDWRWPKSHACMVLAAAVLGVVHKEAQACILSVVPSGAGQNIAFIYLKICLALSKILTKLERFSYAMHHAAEDFDVSAR